MHRNLTLALAAALLACSGNDKDESDIVPLDEGDADTDADADTDTDTDADTDTDVEPGLCDPLPATAGTSVGPADDLAAAVAAASAGDTLLLAAGTYDVVGPIVIDKPLTLRSADDDRASVTIDGGYAGGDLFEVTASDVTFAHLTMTGAGEDFVWLHASGAPITGFRMHDVRAVDGARYGLVVEGDGTDWVDGGEVSCSEFELTDAGRNRIDAICVAGGIDAYGTRDFVVRDSRFLDFWCDFGEPSPAVRFWRGARDTLITRNALVDVGFGIVIGQTQDSVGRLHADEPCGPGYLQSIGGVVTNNMVSAFDTDLLDSTGGVRSGIVAESSCDVSIVHNSVFSAVTPDSSIEYTFETTTGVVANNLLTHNLRRLADADVATVVGNLESQPSSAFFFPAGGDFHTAPGATQAIDQGSPDFLSLVPTDFDDEPRDSAPDIGADEI